YGEGVFQPNRMPADWARHELTPEERSRILHYGDDEPPVFVGQYWMAGKPRLLKHNVACLDYSAVKYGKLVAYRKDDETHLDASKFVWVDVMRGMETKQQ